MKPIPARTSKFLAVAATTALAGACIATRISAEEPPSVSGRYPHLAMYNQQGECGTGAVVPWADRLWVITYAPHQPNGTDDKLYELDTNLKRTIRPESVGGTPANRMIHAETNQLNIGPYFVDAQRNVRVIPPTIMPGRLTATARHLTDPANRLYILDMEGMLYDIDAKTLDVTKLFARMAPGAHCKGGYTGQGRLVMGNNGNVVANKAKPAADTSEYIKDPEAAGVLAEWDGKTWTIDENRQFTDITGPGGINGSPTADSPLWALGWDKRSVMLKLLDGGKWQTFRLPVADYSYVAKHGWYTEWPRIREVGNGKFLMNMHGEWFDFPKTFSAANTAGIKPIGTYLKITGDFCQWNNRLVFGCDDASLLNNPLLGQSQSNLWFTTWDELSRKGSPVGDGGPWVNDRVAAGDASSPYLLAGYSQRIAHLANGSNHPVNFTLEIDADGKGNWTQYETIAIPAKGYIFKAIPADVKGEWIRLKSDVDCDDATAYFHYGTNGGAVSDPAIIARQENQNCRLNYRPTRLRPLAQDPGTLWFSADSSNREPEPTLTYQITPELKVAPYTGKPITEPKTLGAAKDYTVNCDKIGVVVTEAGHRYRLPGMGHGEIREVSTERFLLNAAGSFYMLPYPTAGGAMRMKPVCTHDRQIFDFCSWRGLLALACDGGAAGHYFAAPDNGPGVWLGDIDDLWKMGKPRGEGGPWNETAVKPGEPSDPYLMAGYDQKTVELSHDGPAPVKITLEVDFLANGTWHDYKTFDVAPGQTTTYKFPTAYAAHWVRAKTNTACKATVKFVYE